MYTTIRSTGLPDTSPTARALTRLAAAVLCQARRDITKPNALGRCASGYQRHLREETRAWIRSAATHEGSFSWWCARYGIDPETARDLLTTQ